MWTTIGGWVLTAFTAAVSAGWIAGWRSRSLRRLKTEAELWQALPDSSGRRALLTQIEHDLFEYTWRKHSVEIRRLARIGKTLQVLTVVVLVVMGVLGILLIQQRANLPVRAAAYTSVPALLGLLVGSRVIWRRFAVAIETHRERP